MTVVGHDHMVVGFTTT